MQKTLAYTDEVTSVYITIRNKGARNLTVLVVESLDKKQIATSSPSIPARTSTPGFGGIIASIAFIFIYLIKRKGALCE